VVISRVKGKPGGSPAQVRAGSFAVARKEMWVRQAHVGPVAAGGAGAGACNTRKAFPGTII